MAPSLHPRSAPDPRLPDLARRAPRIPFVGLVEHLERLLHAEVGTTSSGSEAIRFRHDPSLIFHASDVARMVVGRGTVEVTTTFLGATGSVSPLASYFTEDLLRSEGHDSTTLGAFYDLFHHRLLALLYRALKRGRPAWSLRKQGSDALSLRALASVGLPPKRTGTPLSSLAMLGRARILARRPRSKEALAAALALAFPWLTVEIVDFVPRRIDVASEQRLSLGRANHRLGRETRLGCHMTGQSDRIRLKLGPVDRATFDRLLPGGPDHLGLRKVVEDVTGGLLDIEADIEVQKGDEPRAALGRGTRTNGALLGRSTLVLKSRSERTLVARLVLGANGDDSRPTFFQTEPHR